MVQGVAQAGVAPAQHSFMLAASSGTVFAA